MNIRHKLAIFEPKANTTLLQGATETKGIMVKALESLVIEPYISYVIPLNVPKSYYKFLKELVPEEYTDGVKYEIVKIHGKVSILITNETNDTLLLSTDDVICVLSGKLDSVYPLPEPKTSIQATDDFYDMLSNNVAYWSKEDYKDSKELLSSFTFSVLADMDGSGEYPGAVISEYSCSEYISDSIECGDSYSMPDTILYNDGALHEGWYPYIKDKLK